MNFHPDFKEGQYIDIPLDSVLNPYHTPEHIEHAKRELEYRVLSRIAEHANNEHGVNVKLEWVSWRHDEFGMFPVERLGLVAYLSFPKEHIMKAEPFNWSETTSQVYHCLWCGAKDPLDDKYHSGTCENCGGPKL